MLQNMEALSFFICCSTFVCFQVIHSNCISNILEGMISFHGGGGSEKTKRRMASQGVQSFAIAQKVEAAPLRELKQKIDGSDGDE